MKDKIIEILIKHEVKIDDSDYHDVAIFSCDYAQIVAEILAALESETEPAKERVLQAKKEFPCMWKSWNKDGTN